MRAAFFIYVGLFVFSSGMEIAFRHPKWTKMERKTLTYLPEENMNASQMIRYHGYPCEIHKVVTDDGYILTLQRIPHGRNGASSNGIPVFLQHGLIDSAVTWLNNLPEQSLGYIMADAGYDVWLGNSRGNTYSKAHTKFSVDSDEFWDFSFDEMAKYDLPASIDYVLKQTGQQQLHYVGHSQGTMIGFIGFGQSPELGKKVKTFSALAPVATVGHIEGAMKVLSYFTGEIVYLFKLLGVREFFPSNLLMKALAEIVCATHITESACADIVFLLTGFDTSNLNDTRIPVYVAHTPAGTSVKDVVHFAQLVKSQKFQMYDYGEKKNMEKYNSPTPPLYNVTKMETPVALFTGSQDWLADPYDVDHGLRPLLPNIIQDKNRDEWNHMDFVWGEDAHEYFYQDVLKLIAKYS